MMRPSLCLAMTQALGGRVEDALRTAVSIELLHNALLIHDDVQDYSDERRGLPTMQKLHGMPLAINVGDMMTLMSLRPLFENHRELGGPLAMRIIEDTERMTRESAEGQALELRAGDETMWSIWWQRTTWSWCSRKPAGWPPSIR